MFRAALTYHDSKRVSISSRDGVFMKLRNYGVMSMVSTLSANASSGVWKEKCGLRRKVPTQGRWEIRGPM